MCFLASADAEWICKAVKLSMRTMGHHSAGSAREIRKSPAEWAQRGWAAWLSSTVSGTAGVVIYDGAVCQKSEEANADKTMRQHVQEKPA